MYIHVCVYAFMYFIPIVALAALTECAFVGTAKSSSTPRVVPEIVIENTKKKKMIKTSQLYIVQEIECIVCICYSSPIVLFITFVKCNPNNVVDY